MGTNCAPLVANLFLLCYERYFMMSLSDEKQADMIDAFNNTSRYLDDILNIYNAYFDSIVSQIYPLELHLNKANTSDTEATFLDLHLSISNDIDSTKIYDKRDDFGFELYTCINQRQTLHTQGVLTLMIFLSFYEKRYFEKSQQSKKN